MRIGFVYFAEFDAKEVADKVASDHAGVEFVPVNSPSILQIPVTCKKAFNDSTLDCIVSFIQADPEQSSELDLLHEKLVDVELSQEKYVFTVMLLNDEWHSEEERLEKSIKRLNNALKKATAFASHTPTTPEMPDWMPGSQEEEKVEEEPTPEQDMSFMNDVGHKLF